MANSGARGEVTFALKELNDCPETVKQMFLASLPNAYGSNLHPYQQEVAVMIRKSLEGARAAAADTQVSLAQNVQEARTALEACQANVESIQAAEETARTLLEERAAALETRKVAVEAEESVCKTAESSKVSLSAEKQELEEAKAEVESIKNGSFQMLLDGGWEDDEVRDACTEAVCNYLQEQGGDVVLLAALPKALSFPPAARGPFDTIAVDAASNAFLEKIAELTKQVDAAEEKCEDADAEYLGAWAISDVARDQEQLASEERDRADVSLNTLIVEKKVAASNVIDQDATLAAVLSQSTLLDAKVEQLDRAIAGLAILEAGEEESPMAVDKENCENAMVVDKENNGNVVAETDEKSSVMAIEQLPVAMTA